MIAPRFAPARGLTVHRIGVRNRELHSLRSTDILEKVFSHICGPVLLIHSDARRVIGFYETSLNRLALFYENREISRYVGGDFDRRLVLRGRLPLADGRRVGELRGNHLPVAAGLLRDRDLSNWFDC